MADQRDDRQTAGYSGSVHLPCVGWPDVEVAVCLTCHAIVAVKDQERHDRWHGMLTNWIASRA